MWTPILLSLFSLARAEPPTVSISLTDPTGTVHLLEGAVPLEGSEVLEMGKASHRFDYSAIEADGRVKVSWELHEVKGKKDKVVRLATFTLTAAGSNRVERLSWGAPKGATVPDGLNPDLLVWRIVADWEEPAAAEDVTEAPAEQEEIVPPAEQSETAETSGE